MTRTTEADLELKQERQEIAAGRAANGHLIRAVERSGGELNGLSAKMGYEDCLLTLRASFPTGPMVAFIGGFSLGQCLIKAVKEGSKDTLRWKADKYG